MREFLELVLKVSLIIFMVGSLGAMGLELALGSAVAALRNFRFLVLTVVLGFVFCPASAYLIVKVMPLQTPYATGLLLLGMAPSAPFMPLVVRRANGDLAYTAAFMLVSAVGTVMFMPVAAPTLINGLSAGPWVIGKPLLLFVLAPLIVGTGIRTTNAGVASRMCRCIKPCTNLAAVVMLAILVIIYGRGFIGLVGTYAIAAQVIFVATVTGASYWASLGLKEEQRSVLSIGMCTRNIGAAFAPLVAIDADPRAIVMTAFAVPVTLLASFGAARWLAMRSATHLGVAVGSKSDAVGAR